MEAGDSRTGLEIAVIGMAGRFPGARNLDEFWHNLKYGVESIGFFSKEELLESGENSALLESPGYVPAKAILDDTDCFDASFFNYAPAEADQMNPQSRLFLEYAWAALENAGYSPRSYEGLIGLYAGASSSFSWEVLKVLAGNRGQVDGFSAVTLKDKDFLTTRVSYKLGLTGPGYQVHTACSTSMTAIHAACRALLMGECDMALAGGVSITIPQKTGYLYAEGMVNSPDGHCRAFDAKAKGTVPGDGIGVVVLKPLEDAVAAGDFIYAVVKSTACNNDGPRRAGYTAPSLEGQAECIRTALRMAGVEPESIGCIETHGTGTELGDPIEIEALKLAFDTDKKKFCAIGSVKTNIGHLDTAAGVAGFIKAVLAIYHREIPPSLHFETPNPKIDFENNPFYVNTELSGWQDDTSPLRAGVSSFGIGGTNVHVILEEPPVTERRGSSKEREYRLILLSAKTLAGLDSMTKNLVEYLQIHPDINLGDMAYTLQRGRSIFRHRRMTVCSTVDETIAALSNPEDGKVAAFSTREEVQNPPVVFMFSGLGSEYVNMGRELYEKEPFFRQEMDGCFKILQTLADFNVKEILYPTNNGVSSPGGGPVKPESIHEPEISPLIIFIFEYALAKLLMNWGINPRAMIGYSFGEYAAACIAGVFSLGDALRLVVARGRLIGKTGPGAMSSVPLSRQELLPLLPSRLSLAIDNDSSCIVSGPGEVVEEFEKQMKNRRCLCMRLPFSTAIHSSLMDPIAKELEDKIRELERNAPQIPYISNVTGAWIGAHQAVDPGYWSTHLRQTVCFADGIKVLVKEFKNALFVEIGAGRDISSLVVRYIENDPGHNQRIIHLVRHPQKNVSDVYFLLNQVGRLWLYDKSPDWNIFYAHEKRYRIPLPTYPFERQRYPIDGNPFAMAMKMLSGLPSWQEKPDLLDNRQEAVPLFAQRRSELGIEYVAPRNEREKTLAQIWADFLGFDRIGIADDFFELGGDSLKAMTVTARIHEVLNVSIPISEFYKRSTIGTLAGYIETAGEQIYSALEATEKKEYYPLSTAQKRLYMLQQIDPGSEVYNNPQALVLEGELDGKKLEGAFRKLIDRHESYRTSFIAAAGEVAQKVYETGQVEFKIEYYGADSIRDFVRPFDPGRPPLFRVGLIKSGEQKHILLIDIHHIITDGTSQMLFMKELTAFYAGREEELPALKIRYKDYAEWQSSGGGREAVRLQEDYWLKEFAGEIPVVNLPTDFPRPDIQGFEGRLVPVRVDKGHSKVLKKIALEEGVSLFSILLAILTVFISKITGQDDISIGTEIAGRGHTEVGHVHGLFLNTLVLRNFPRREKTFGEFVKEVMGKTLKAFDNQEYPFELLTEKVLGKRDVSRNPFFDVMLIWQNMEAEPLRLPGLTLTPYHDEVRRSALIDLTIYGQEQEELLAFALEYNTALFKEATILRFISYFNEIIAAVTANKEIKLGDITISHDLGRAAPEVFQDSDGEFGF
jgi:phthiocerol/phenolphthiocerol synthesis type-I polyketide synthase E